MKAENPLLDAVDALTKPRMITTKFINEISGIKYGEHTVRHPPLLTLLLEGTGIPQRAASSDIKIPIDADKLELWATIRDMIRLWCRQLDCSYDSDDLLVSTTNWHLGHVNALRSSRIDETIDHDVTRMVESWVRMITNKFEPDDIAEWKKPCPALLPVRNIDGDDIGWRRCGARRMLINKVENFAIQINWTKRTAECHRCRTKWEGKRGLLDLSAESARYDLESASTDVQREIALAELARLAKTDVTTLKETISA